MTKPRTLWDCQPVMAMMALSVAPAGCFRSAITRAALVSVRTLADSGAGVTPVGRLPVLSRPEAACAPTWGFSTWMAAQIRRTPVDDVFGHDRKEGASGTSRVSVFREDGVANRKAPASTNFGEDYFGRRFWSLRFVPMGRTCAGRSPVCGARWVMRVKKSNA